MQSKQWLRRPDSTHMSVLRSSLHLCPPPPLLCAARVPSTAPTTSLHAILHPFPSPTARAARPSCALTASLHLELSANERAAPFVYFITRRRRPCAARAGRPTLAARRPRRAAPARVQRASRGPAAAAALARSSRPHSSERARQNQIIFCVRRPGAAGHGKGCAAGGRAAPRLTPHWLPRRVERLLNAAWPQRAAHSGAAPWPQGRLQQAPTCGAQRRPPGPEAGFNTIVRRVPPTDLPNAPHAIPSPPTTPPAAPHLSPSLTTTSASTSSSSQQPHALRSRSSTVCWRM
jgi:hypothetical protein